MKKFELTTDSIKGNGTTLYRIKALIDFGDVKAGDLGGYVEKEENLSQYGNAWVYDDAWVHGDAWVCDDTCVCDDALIFSNADYICLKSFGSHNRSTTMFRGENENIYVSCGCFSGTLQEFESKVKETYGNNKFAREYLALVEAAKIHFEV